MILFIIIIIPTDFFQVLHNFEYKGLEKVISTLIIHHSP